MELTQIKVANHKTIPLKSQVYTVFSVFCFTLNSTQLLLVIL